MINKKEPQTAATVQGASEINSQDDYIRRGIRAQVRLNMLYNVCMNLVELKQKSISVETVLFLIGGAEDV